MTNKPDSISLNDGLKIFDTYITCAVKCVPPGDKPNSTELKNCFKRVKIGIKNQVGKITLRPRLRLIFQCFQGIHYVVLREVKQIVNLTEERRLILSLLPASCQRYYL